MTHRPLSLAEAVGLPVIGALSLLLAWQWLVPALGIPAYIVPTPLAILRTLGIEWRFLLSNAIPTWGEAGLGFLLGNSLAVIMAIAFVYNPRLQAAYFPVVLLFNTIPVLALAPIIILIFGLSMLPKVIIAALICFFPTLVNTARGLNLATASELDLMHVLSASGWETFWRLRAPRSAPLLFASLRISATTCVIGAIVGEWIGSNQGLGAVIIQSTFNYQAERLFAAVVLASFSGIVFFAAVAQIERIFRRLQPRQS
ncbi:ABC transporter permease [Rhizobium laguerreae]|uniref:ABC transporter permease n=1 Tax=Rhizobium laguerreae TaxID=1076926 RepID=UPI001C91ACC3|nr:ABC transporter permease [Rhizobium laguerreae]MBY3348851.1 ABC transporter permease [Rhizobium laguerreae]MBY3355917.1 ABC transporter permease [Rhizobium laguerreae]MBY3367838.1 ABC transporter permease [Rhizobium laguerreae]MBY3377004.1 ABC transporter permease [Rhizobium laguerreae]MBY3388732.1 ABC transporter permease [Rhizobium laguerreae]